VRQLRAMVDVAEGQQALAAVARALDEHGLKRVLVDQRGTGAQREDVREQFWGWMVEPGRLDAIALVLDSELAGVEANMTAISRHLKLRAFTDRLEAEQWVRRTVPGRQTGFFGKLD